MVGVLTGVPMADKGNGKSNIQDASRRVTITCDITTVAPILEPSLTSTADENAKTRSVKEAIG